MFCLARLVELPAELTWSLAGLILSAARCFLPFCRRHRVRCRSCLLAVAAAAAAGSFVLVLTHAVALQLRASGDDRRLTGRRQAR